MIFFAIFLPLLNASNPLNSSSYQNTKDMYSLVDTYYVNPKWSDNGEDFYYYDPLEDSLVFFNVSDRKKSLVLTNRQLSKIKKNIQFKDNIENLVKNFKINKKSLFLEHASYQYKINLNNIDDFSKTKLNKPIARVVRDKRYPDDQAYYESLSKNKKQFLSLNNIHGLSLRNSFSDDYIKIIDAQNLLKNNHEWQFSDTSWSDSSKHVLIKSNKIIEEAYYYLTAWDENRPNSDKIYKVPYLTPLDPMAEEWLYLIDTEANTIAKVFDRDKFFVNIEGWISDKEFIYSKIDRYYKTRTYYLSNTNGETKSLFTESTDTYLPEYNISGREKVIFLYKNKRFAHYLSERSGKRQIYHLDIDSGELKRLSLSNNLIVENILGYNEEKDIIYFTAFGEDQNPYYLHFYSIKNTKIKRLSPLGTNHYHNAFRRLITSEEYKVETIQISPNKKYFIDSHSNLKQPMKVDLRKLPSGNLVKNLGESQITKLSDLNWIAPEEFSVKASDGKTDLRGVIFKPFNFDPEKKYPIINFIYGGPQFSWLPTSFLTTEHSFATSMAQLGYIVVMLDARGNPDRGKAFQDYNYQKFGQVEVYDHVYALEQLFDRFEYIDSNRVGLIGSSFGGFQTLNFISRVPSFFKVAVANAAVADLRDVHARSVEIFMGDPFKNNTAYEQSSVFNFIENMDTQLLLLHGALDTNAPLFGMLKLTDFMVEKNIHFDFFLDPSAAHSRTDYTWEKIRRYFYQNL